MAGPILFARWDVPCALRERLQAERRPLPEPVTGGLQLDTGARRTCISEHAARDLELRPTRLSKTYGAGGVDDLEVVRACLVFVDPGGEAPREISIETEALVIPGLEAGGAHLGLNQAGRELRLVGLIGRDLLQHVQWTYDGPKGAFAFKIDLVSLSRSKLTTVR